MDKIGEFDLIILDRFQNRGLLPLPYLANIANRVRQGGALLLSVGPEFSGATSLAATPLGAACCRAVRRDATRWSMASSGRGSPTSASAIR